MNDPVDYSGYDNLVPDEKDNCHIDFNGYDSLNNTDLLDQHDIQPVDDYKEWEPEPDIFSAEYTSPAIKRDFDITQSADFKFLQSFDTKKYLDEQVAETLGIDADRIELAKSCGILDVERVDDGTLQIHDSLLHNPLVNYGLEIGDACRFPRGTAMMITMGSFSAASSLCYSVCFPNGEAIPIGLYVCAGQPPASGKSSVLGKSLKPIQRGLGIIIRDTIAENEKNKSDTPVPMAVLSNSTPESLEKLMTIASSGRFVLASAEQGALEKILNMDVKDRSTDADIVLKGYMGEYHSSSRVTRSGYAGEIFGTIVVIAQDAIINKVIASSDGKGIAERFLFIGETPLIGDRPGPHRAVNKDMQHEYEQKVSSIFERFRRLQTTGFDELKRLKFCENGYKFLHDLFFVCEPKLKKYRNDNAHMMMSALGKVDQHIMKVAANLHIYHSIDRGGNVPEIIDFRWVEAAAYLCFQLVFKLESILIKEGEMGQEAKVCYVLSKFDNKRRMMTHKQLVDLIKNNKKHFLGSKDASELIKNMLENGALVKSGNNLRPA